MKLSTAMIFGNHMVLQCGKRIPVWGVAVPGATVTVTIQGKNVTTTADENGNWKALLPELEVSFRETMIIKSGQEEIIYEQAAVGEVWLAGGQSNMEFHMRYDANMKEEKNLEENPNVRFFDYPETAYEGALEERDYSLFGFWRTCDGDNLEYFSAVGYYFAKNLASARNVPVGIVGCNWGGSSSCCWMPEEQIRKSGGEAWISDYEAGISGLDMEQYEKAYKANPMNDRSHPFNDPFMEMLMSGLSREEQLKLPLPGGEMKMIIGPLDPWRPSGLYHMMLKKIIPYAIRGVLLYQGESDDSHAGLYKEMLKGLITCWREQWHEELPFLMVQLAPFGQWMANTGENYPILRRAQEEAAGEMNNVWLASSGDVGMLYDIHPKKKKPIGERLALLARGHVYDEEIVCDAPVLKKAVWNGNILELHFEHAKKLEVRGDTITALLITGQYSLLREGTYHVNVSDNRINIEFDEFPEDRIKVEFAQTAYYEVNLYNEAGIPVKTFDVLA